MTKIAELPIIDGCVFLDNSTLEYLTTCTRSMEYYFVRKRILGQNRSALTFGGAIHAGLETRYRVWDEPPPLPAMIIAATEYMSEHQHEANDHRTLDLATKILRVYADNYSSEPFKVLSGADDQPLVEKSFCIELCSLPYDGKKITFFYIGKIDLIIQMDDRCWTLDHKTTSMMGTGFFEEQSVNPQHEGYCWSYWKATGTLPAGFYINAIRVRPPTLGVDKFGNAKAKKREDVEPADFQRERCYVTEERLLEWEFNTVALLEEFLFNASRDYFPQKKKWCVAKYGRCQYYDICTLPKASREVMIQSPLYIDQTWSPLKK